MKLFTPDQQAAINALVAKRVAEEMASRPAVPGVHPQTGAKAMSPTERRKAVRQLIGLSAKASYLQGAAAGGHVSKALAEAAVKSALELEALFVANKAAGATGTLFSEGGSLLAEEYSEAVIGVLYDAMVVLESGARPEAVRGGKKNLGRLNAGAVAEFVMPGQELSTSTINTGMVILSPKKCMGLIEPTKDMLRDPSLAGGNDIFTADLLNAIGTKMDQQCIVGDGTGPRPLGLVGQIKAGNKFNATSAFVSANAAAIIADLDKAERLVRESKHTFQGAKPGWVMTSKTLMALKSLRDSAGWIFRAQLDQGMLNGYPVKVTDSISGKGTAGKDLLIFGLWDTVSFGLGFGGEAPNAGIIIEMSEPKFTADLVSFKGVGYADAKARYDSTLSVIDSIVYA